jgi:hypothetical protein
MQRFTVYKRANISLEAFETPEGTLDGKAAIDAPNTAQLTVAGFGSKADAEQELLAIARLEIDGLSWSANRSLVMDIRWLGEFHTREQTCACSFFLPCDYGLP